MGGKIGVNVYILISGFFLVKSKSLSFEKVLKLWLQIFSFSIVIYVIFVLTNKEQFSLLAVVKSIFPITFNQYWFASTYFVLYIISPFVNKFIYALNKTEYKKMLLGCTVLWLVLPTFTTSWWQSNELIWFIFLYMIAGYIQLHLDVKIFEGWICRVLCVTFIVLTFLAVIVFDLLGTKYIVFANHATYLYGMNKINVLMISILLFLIFLNLKIKSNRIINVLASATFGVYLIHDNPLVRNFLWYDVFKGSLYSEWFMLIPYSLFAILSVYLCCTLIELFRVYLLERNYLKVFNEFKKVKK